MASKERKVRGRFQTGDLHFEIDEAAGTLRCGGEKVYPERHGPLPHSKQRWTEASFRLLCSFLRDGKLPISTDTAPVSRLRNLLGDVGKRRCITCARGVAWYWVPALEELPDSQTVAEGGLSESDGVAKAGTVQDALKEIAGLTSRPWTPRQQHAVDGAVNECLRSLRAIEDGQIKIAGTESDYFDRFFACIDEHPTPPEHIKAYIRLIALHPSKLEKWWFGEVYQRLEAKVRLGKATIEYIFLVRKLTSAHRRFLARYETFAERISYVCQWDSKLRPECLEPSIVLMEHQKRAFTHDRGKGAKLKDVFEWTSAQHFEKWRKQYSHIALMSTCVFSRKRKRQRTSAVSS